MNFFAQKPKTVDHDAVRLQADRIYAIVRELNHELKLARDMGMSAHVHENTFSRSDEDRLSAYISVKL